MRIYEAAKWAVCICALSVGTVEDIRYRKIHIIIPVVAAIVGVVINIAYSGYSFVSLAADSGPGIAVMAYCGVCKDKIGPADGITVIMIGILAGMYNAVCIMFLASAATAVYLAAKILGGKMEKTEGIAFLPFLAIVCLVYFVYICVCGVV